MPGQDPQSCPICRAPSAFLRRVDEVAFFRCTGCGSFHADNAFLDAVDRGAVVNYDNQYWTTEIESAQERSYGGSIARVAETLRLSRIEVRRFLDIGTGPGFLLDSLAALLPNSQAVFHGVELMPPPEPNRCRHPNYHIGSIADLDGVFDGGTCIEVIEHLTPSILRVMAQQLAARSSHGALWYFNSAQPSFVESVDPGYLDPKGRGHIMSWSIAGARAILAPLGFNVIALPARDWAFLAEFGPAREVTADDLLTWLWHPVAANLEMTRGDAFGPLFRTIGVESARCYLEAALAENRAHWARGLLDRIREPAEPCGVSTRPIWSRWFRRRGIGGARSGT